MCLKSISADDCKAKLPSFLECADLVDVVHKPGFKNLITTSNAMTSSARSKITELLFCPISANCVNPRHVAPRWWASRICGKLCSPHNLKLLEEHSTCVKSVSDIIRTREVAPSAARETVENIEASRRAALTRKRSRADALPPTSSFPPVTPALDSTGNSHVAAAKFQAGTVRS